ncbi:hypothetical protein [Cryptosporidium parvum Iowa II]|uniref:Predicted secreted protein n=3 Tax=Cryptosporidium parvum TaxID=5807 RepID=Q5CVM2_CRYPI|nr:hypothetical protein [Cryptosporidium parvum Iowa II]EAK89516.1 predicted secreted protein [Cryptosporidium parvum Iowa II]QOY40119.1 putative Secreted Protein (WYLE gene family) [Cryptosporidium parvum]WRK34117.1 putative Secreted Protein (WYLE gene family) [Cryptosporidium parvum]|eukprot:QOY40119.1 hypothetical protein CPATCC_004201 [Cryptosporidium parvum]
MTQDIGKEKKMRDILFLILPLVIVTISCCNYIESASIADSTRQFAVKIDEQGKTSKVTDSKPISADSTPKIDKDKSYIDDDKLLNGRKSTWNRFITLIIDNVKPGENWESALSTKSNEYFGCDSPQRIFCSDHYEHEILSDKFFIPTSVVPVHLPTEAKPNRITDYIKRTFDLNLSDTIKLSNFPRVKHFRRSLVLLPSEPYQRVMTFAIEQCMVPSTWYLELIHCMYLGMAPKFLGMVFSYSLKDIIGAALMSVGYKDERFIMENCFYAVSLVVDDYISPHYREICIAVHACLESKHFERYFSKQKREFETRIANTYSHIPEKLGFLKPMEFYRYAVLLSMSLIKDKNVDIKIYPERNFLPIRIALASLAYYAISTNQSWVFDTEKKVLLFFTKTILNMLFEVSLLSIPGCVKKLAKFSHEAKADKEIIFELFCKEIFSAGFIVDATIESYADPNLHSMAVMPQRVLHPSYSSFVPDLTNDVKYSEDESWINAQIEVSKPEVVRPGRVQKVFKSKTLIRTFRRDHYNSGIGPKSMDASSRKIKTGKVTRISFKSFTNKLTKRRSK